LINERAVRETVDDVVAALLSIPEGEEASVRSAWPSGKCEIAACAIAAVLEDRQLGEWTMVSGHHGGQMSGHMWLTHESADGQHLFSIDVTLHQFPLLSPEPFVGPGASPARAWFNNRTSEYRLWDWPWLGGESNGSFIPTIRVVRERLKGAKAR